jgi:hypothetical protein
MFYSASKMTLPDVYNYRPRSGRFPFSKASARDAVIVHFPGSVKPNDVFQGDKVKHEKLHEFRNICRFLAQDRYFEMLGKTAEQASVDSLRACNKRSSR